MPRATPNGMTLAESDQTVVVGGNHYFPTGSVDRDLFGESDATTRFPRKGGAGHLSVEDAARYYPEPMPAAENTRDNVSFHRDEVAG